MPQQTRYACIVHVAGMLIAIPQQRCSRCDYLLLDYVGKEVGMDIATVQVGDHVGDFEFFTEGEPVLVCEHTNPTFMAPLAALRPDRDTSDEQECRPIS
jgi:hypothetical protein